MFGDIVSKSVVSISEMARMAGLSRARFYQLVKKGTFPPADEDPITKRPCYFEEKQRLILEARRRNCGVDGKPVLFYCRRSDVGVKRTSSRPTIDKAKNVVKKYKEVIEGLAALNVTASVSQVEPILKELYPKGTDDLDLGEVIRTVFLEFRRRHSSDSEGGK